MELNEFREEFLDQVRARASAGANFTHAEFVEVCAELLGDAEELADFEACFYRERDPEIASLGVDGFAMDDLDGSIRLVIAEYGGEAAPTTLTQTHAKTCFSRLLAFCGDALSGRLHRELEESAPGYSLALTLYERRKSIFASTLIPGHRWVAQYENPRLARGRSRRDTDRVPHLGHQ